MGFDRGDAHADRLKAAQKAKQALVAKFKEVKSSPELAARQAEYEETARARDARQRENAERKAAEAARRREEEAALAAAAAKAKEEEMARREAARMEKMAMAAQKEAEAKAKRDARYAARKARSGKK